MFGVNPFGFPYFGEPYAASSGPKIVAVAQATETDTAQAITRVKRKTLGQPSETDAAQPITRVKRKTLGQPSETDTAQIIQVKPRVRQVTETDTAQPLSKLKVKAVGQATGTNTAQPITGAKIKAIGQASQVEIAQPITPALAALGEAVPLYRPRMVALANYRLEVAWELSPGGLFVLGTSQLGGSDVLAASGWSETFGGDLDDLTGDIDDDGLEVVRGRTDDLAMMAAGQLTARLRDPDGKYNRENRHSPLYGLLNPLRATRLSATLDYRSCVLSDAPVAYWRLGDAIGVPLTYDLVNRIPAAHDTGAVSGAPGLLASDTDLSAAYSGSATAHSTISARDLVVLFAGNEPWSIEAWIVAPELDGADRVIFASTEVGGGAGVILSASSTRIRVTRRDALASDDLDYTIAMPTSPRHITATYDGEILALYVAGDLVAAIPSVRSAPVGRQVGIGANIGGGAPAATSFRGIIDEVAVYPEALDPYSIEAHYDAGVGTRFPIFYGFTRRIEQSPSGRGGVATLTAVDLFNRLARARPIIAATGATSVGSVWGRMLDWIEWHDPAMRSLATGTSLATFAADGGDDILRIGETLLEIDRGNFFIAASGAATYYDRDTRSLMPLQSVIRRAVRAISSGADLESVQNIQKTLRSGGVVQEARDDPSIDAYGEAEGGLIESPWLVSDASALSTSQYVVLHRKDPASDLWSLDLKNRDSATLRAMLARDLIDRVLVGTEEGEEDEAVSSEYHVEQITHRISRGGLSHSTAWRMSERGPEPFLLGSSLLGGVAVLG